MTSTSLAPDRLAPSARNAFLLAAAVAVVGGPSWKVAASSDSDPPPSGPTIPRACSPPHDAYPFCDHTLSLSDRLTDLLSRLTLEEKAALLIARNSPRGSVPRLGLPAYDWGGNCLHGVQSRCFPPGSDEGGKDGRCPTSFPMPNALGTSFNRTAWRTMGRIIGTELRALFVRGVGENHPDSKEGGPALPAIGLDCWSPVVEVVRDPRWGRTMESPGEDPLLCGTYGREVTEGLQGVGGDDPRYLQAISTLKHFDANSLEGNWYDAEKNVTYTRHNIDAHISEYDLRSTYLKPFQLSVEGDGGAEGVMCSYNSINGVPSCANPWLLTDVLRDEWGFDGYVTTDSGAIDDVVNGHKYSPDWTSAVSDALRAGCDMESATWKAGQPWSTGGPYEREIPMAVSKGTLNISDVDRAVRHTVGLRFRLGLFDPVDDQPYWKVPPSAVGSDGHADEAMDATLQSLVLLKNDDGILPFPAGTKIAVVGPQANHKSTILGNYLGQICPDKYGSVDCVDTVFESIRDRNGGGGTTVWAKGCDVNTTDDSGIDEAVKAADDADYVVFVGGLDGTMENESHDRHDVALPSLQRELLLKLCSLDENSARIGGGDDKKKKKVVAVLFHGGMIALDRQLVDACPAFVSAGYPGFFGGWALAMSLLDASSSQSSSSSSSPSLPAANRWGRLGTTWYESDEWTDASYDMTDFDMGGGRGRTHRYYTGSPLFPFGHGLSYVEGSEVTSDVRVVEEGGGGEEGMSVTAIVVSLTNHGRRDADDIVFLYSTALEGTVPDSEPAGRMVRELLGFERVGLGSGGGTAADVSFEFGPELMRRYGADGKPKLFEGRYVIDVVWSGGVRSLAMECDSDRGCIMMRAFVSETAEIER